MRDLLGRVEASVSGCVHRSAASGFGILAREADLTTMGTYLMVHKAACACKL